MMNRFFYTCLLWVILPIVPIKLVLRGIKQPAYKQHWRERFGFYTIQTSKPVIWLHCVSVGETRAAEPLIKALQCRYPQHQILLTHTTPTGRETSYQLFGDSVICAYLPYDLPFAIKHFLKHFKPKIGLLMETELWFNLIDCCKQKNIPLLLLNARLSEKSAIGYSKLGRLITNGLQDLSAIAAQTSDDAARFQKLGATNVSVYGNLKFDVKAPATTTELGSQLRQLLIDNHTPKPQLIFLAASTREGEEALILDAIKGLDILTIIVPRHPQRFDEVAKLIESKNIAYARRTSLSKPIDSATQVILGDSMNELFTYYAACDFTFIGGSLLNFGGQNLIEAASLGKPILIGKYTFNFADASKNAVRAGAAIRFKNTDDLRESIVLLRDNLDKRQKMQQAALRFSEASQGATLRIMKLIEEYLPV